MSRKVAIFDTSLLCCWLKVPGMEQAGSGPNAWDSARVEALVQSQLKLGSTIVLPLATIIETGNHISQSPKERFKFATEFAKHLKSAAQSEPPWAAFVEQSVLWGPDQMLLLADEWPKLAETKFSLGDATIKRVADYYAQAGCEVTILTADKALGAYEPEAPTRKPRRRL